jgi:hypothetical protein
MLRVCCVTAFKDINRGEWDKSGVKNQRKTEEYLTWFGHLANLPIDLICFCDEPVASQIRQRTSFNKIYPYNDYDSFAKYLNVEKSIMNNPNFKNILAESGKAAPEHTVPWYNVVNHNKVKFVRRAYEMNSGYTHYAWIDFGHQRGPSSKNISWDHLLNNSINYAVDKKYNYNKIPEPEEIVKNKDEFTHLVQGALFVLPASLVRWYESAYEESLREYYSKNVVDSDQSIALRVIKNYPEKFKLHVRSEPFTLFYQ